MPLYEPPRSRRPGFTAGRSRRSLEPYPIDFRDEAESEAEEDAEKQSVETTTVNEDAAEPTNADANADAKPDIGMEDASADAEPCADASEDAEMQDKDGTGEDEDLAGSFEEELSEICEDDPVLEDSCCWPASFCLLYTVHFGKLRCSKWFPWRIMMKAIEQPCLPITSYNNIMTNMTAHDYAYSICCTSQRPS